MSTLRALHAWLDSWRGIGLIVDGMERYGFRLSLKKYGNGDGAWVAQFLRDVLRQRTDAVAVQMAAWGAIKKAPPADFR